MDLPLDTYMGKSGNNIYVKTIYYKNKTDDQEGLCIMIISDAMYSHLDNYSVSKDNAKYKTNSHNVTFKGRSYSSLATFVEQFIDYQKTHGWNSSIEYKCVHSHIISSISSQIPVDCVKDEYILTFTK